MPDKITVTQTDRELLCTISSFQKGSECYEKAMAGLWWTWEVEQIARHRLAQTDAQMAAPNGLAAELAALVPGKPLDSEGEFHYFVPTDLMDRILASLSASNVMRDALTKARRELYLLSLNEGARDHEIGVLITQIDAALAGQGTTSNVMRDALIAAPKALIEEACLLSLRENTVTIECDSREEAEELFNWLANKGHHANLHAMRVALDRTADWLNNLADADLDEIAADGGITVGMVVQQEARWRATLCLRASMDPNHVR